MLTVFLGESCMWLWREKEEFEWETDTVVWGFAPGCGGHFCKLRFWLVSGAKATLVTACAGDAGCGPHWCVAAPSCSTPGDVGLCKCAPESGPQECYGWSWNLSLWLRLWKLDELWEFKLMPYLNMCCKAFRRHVFGAERSSLWCTGGGWIVVTYAVIPSQLLAFEYLSPEGWDTNMFFKGPETLLLFVSFLVLTMW